MNTPGKTVRRAAMCGVAIAACGAAVAGEAIASHSKLAQRERPGELVVAAPVVTSSSGPCSLLSTKQVETITGRTVKRRTLAPLGPTCIYQFRRGSEITLVVEAVSFSRVSRQLRDRTRTSVGHRSAACGKLGETVMYVSLPAGRVLAIQASCSVAGRIGAIAVRKLVA